MKFLRAALLAAGAALAETGGRAEESTTAAWQALSIGFYADAGDRFAAAAAGPDAQLGAALSLINRPPVTGSSLALALQQFTVLAGRPDEIGRAARYFLGRLQQLHPSEPDLPAAAREYETLVATGADDVWCRLALVKLVILQLTVLPEAGGPPVRFARVEQAFARTRDDATRRDLHLVIAEARLNHRLHDSATLAHLQTALQLTASGDIMRPDLLVQVGRLATQLGERDTARRCFQAFLADYPKERRHFTVASALAQLDGGLPP